MAVVIDANIGVAVILDLSYSDSAVQQMQQWQESRTEILVPSLWSYEVVSALRKANAAQALTNEETTRALDDFFELKVQVIEPSLELHRSALMWAARLKQIVVYDAHYLALAEREGAEFWTADKLLATRALEAGASWVRWLPADSEK